MSACSLYFDPSSDDESEQLNRIREKLKRRRVDELNLDTSDDDESCNDEKTSCHNLHHYDKTGNNNKDDIDDDSVISFCITNMIAERKKVNDISNLPPLPTSDTYAKDDVQFQKCVSDQTDFRNFKQTTKKAPEKQLSSESLLLAAPAPAPINNMKGKESTQQDLNNESKNESTRDNDAFRNVDLIIKNDEMSSSSIQNGVTASVSDVGCKLMNEQCNEKNHKTTTAFIADEQLGTEQLTSSKTHMIEYTTQLSSFCLSSASDSSSIDSISDDDDSKSIDKNPSMAADSIVGLERSGSLTSYISVHDKENVINKYLEVKTNDKCKDIAIDEAEVLEFRPKCSLADGKKSTINNKSELIVPLKFVTRNPYIASKQQIFSKPSNNEGKYESIHRFDDNNEITSVATKVNPYKSSKKLKAMEKENVMMNTKYLHNINRDLDNDDEELINLLTLENSMDECKGFPIQYPVAQKVIRKFKENEDKEEVVNQGALTYDEDACAFGFEDDFEKNDVHSFLGLEGKNESKVYYVQPDSAATKSPLQRERIHPTDNSDIGYTQSPTLDSVTNDDQFETPYTTIAQEKDHANDITMCDTALNYSDNALASEILPHVYSPIPKIDFRDPIIHQYTHQNRILESRTMLPVVQLYDSPINRLWTSKFEKFNHLQSEIANTLAYSDDNVVISAPTGAGKTVAFEIAMARFFLLDLQSMGTRQQSSSKVSKFRKIVYLAPSKALCEERFKDWSARFTSINLGIETVVVTGDSDPSEAFRDVASAHLILTTPEKWDSLTRRWTEKFILFSTIKLFMIDEVHLIADESRGCCLESILCRMKTIQYAASIAKVSEVQIASSSYSNTTPEAINLPFRMVAVSATLPNIADIASFLEANEAYMFDESYRPVPLSTYVIGQGKLGDNTSGHFHFWRNLDRGVPEIIRRFCSNRPSIVFCHSKAETEKLSDALATSYNIGQRNYKSDVASMARTSRLQRVLMYGIAYHHAGLEGDDRKLVETAFTEGKIRVLCATSTLAMGVNLPAHLVVIKGTKAYRGASKGYQDLDQATLLQMIGRAGRPGFDTSGTAVIMTDNDSKTTFEKLASSGLPASMSQLMNKFVETVNVEISQRVITSIESAINWMKMSLFYIQLVKNPSNYGVDIVSVHSIDTYLLQQCTKAINMLKSIGVVASTDGQELIPCPASHIMSQQLVEFQAMELISKIAYDVNQCQLLKELAQIEGLQFPVRRLEKKFLNEAHKQLKTHKLDGPISKVRVQDPWEKAFILMQVYIDEPEVEISFTLRQEMNAITEYAARMLTAIEEYSIQGSKHGNIIVQSLKFRRALTLRQWNSQDGVLRQIHGINKSLSFTLHMGGISTFDDVLKTTEKDLERITCRPAPFGMELRKACALILQSRLEIRASIEAGTAGKTGKVICQLERKASLDRSDLIGSTGVGNSNEVTYTLIAFINKPEGNILYRPLVTGPGIFEARLPRNYCKISVYLIASIAGLDEKVELEGNEETVQPASMKSNQQCQDEPYRRIRDSTKRNVGLDTTSVISRRAADVNGLAISHVPKHRESLHNTSTCGKLLGAVTPSPKPMVASISRHILMQQNQPKQYTDFDSDIVFQSNDTRRSGTNEYTTTRSGESSEYSGAPNNSRRSEANEYSTTRSGENSVYSGAPRTVLNLSQAPTMKHDYPFISSGSTISQRWLGGNQSQQTTWNRSAEAVTLSSGAESRNQCKEMWNSSKTEALIPGGSVSWKRVKNQQQKTQRRAFARKKDNPFSCYQYDPNNTESYLDALTTRSSLSPNDSLIPEKGLRALEDAYKERRNGVICSGSNNFSMNRKVRDVNTHRGKYNSSIRMSNQDLLSLKAAEQNTYRNHNVPNDSPWVSSQATYSMPQHAVQRPQHYPVNYTQKWPEYDHSLIETGTQFVSAPIYQEDTYQDNMSPHSWDRNIPMGVNTHSEYPSSILHEAAPTVFNNFSTHMPGSNHNQSSQHQFQRNMYGDNGGYGHYNNNNYDSANIDPRQLIAASQLYGPTQDEIDAEEAFF